MRAVGGDGVQRGWGEPLGVLVEQVDADAKLRDLLKQRGERARRCAVVDLDLVEEDVELASPVWRDVGASLGGVEDVVDDEVGDQPVARRPRAGTDEHDLALVHRAPHVIGAQRVAEQRSRWRRDAQAVDQVGDRRDGLGRQPWEALLEELPGRRRHVRQDRRAPLVVGEQGGDLEDRRRELGWEALGEVAQRLAGLGGQVQRSGVRLIPAQRRRERVDQCVDLVLDLAGGAAGGGEEVPAGLARVVGEVDLDDAVAQPLAGEVGLDLVQRVLVRVEEEAAVAGAGEVDELADRGLGLAEPRPARHVGEERVRQRDADDAVARLVGRLAEREQVPLAGERRQSRRWRADDPARAQHVRSRALDGRRFEQPGDLRGSHDPPPRRPEQAGREPAVEPASPARQVGAEERHAGDAQARHAEVVVAGERIEGGQQPGKPLLRDPGRRRGDADQDLQLEHRLGRTELADERAEIGAALHQLRRGRTAPARLRTEEVGERTAAVSLHRHDLTVGLAEQPLASASPPARCDRQQVDADRRVLSVAGSDSLDRPRDRGERIGVEAGVAQRLAAPARQHQLRPRDLHPRRRLGVDRVGVVNLDLAIGRRQHAPPRPRRQLDPVPQPLRLVGVEPHPHRTRALLQQVAQRVPRPAQTGRERHDRIVGRVERIGRDQHQPRPERQRAASEHETGDRDEHSEGHQSRDEGDGRGAAREAAQRSEPVRQRRNDVHDHDRSDDQEQQRRVVTIIRTTHENDPLSGIDASAPAPAGNAGRASGRGPRARRFKPTATPAATPTAAPTATPTPPQGSPRRLLASRRRETESRVGRKGPIPNRGLNPESGPLTAGPIASK